MLRWDAFALGREASHTLLMHCIASKAHFHSSGLPSTLQEGNCPGGLPEHRTPLWTLVADSHDNRGSERCCNESGSDWPAGRLPVAAFARQGRIVVGRAQGGSNET